MILDRIIIAAFALTVLFGNFFEFHKTANEIEEQTLRLHIVAHSDSEVDQSAKLMVRDALLEGTGDLFTTGKSKNSVLLAAQSHLPLIEKIASDTLAELSLYYNVVAYTTKMHFDTTSYEGFTMPAGQYSAVRIELGDAKGENWWCVLFPPLCLPSVEGEVTVEAMFNEEQLELISGEYDIKFKTLEMIEDLFGSE